MRIFKRAGVPVRSVLHAGAVALGAGSMALVLVAWSGERARAASTLTFTSPEAAYEQGIGAYRAERPEIAAPALQFAADAGHFYARFFLAELLSDAGGVLTDHGRAFQLYEGLVEAFSDLDERFDRRGQLVAQAHVALAHYLQTGVPSAGIAPDADRARHLLNYAATVFANPTAQFEFAKLLLDSEGSPSDVANGKHWLSTLAKKGHAGAQGYLAELFWFGRHVTRKPVLALALSTMAVRNAPEIERIWIDENHQIFYCGAGERERKRARALVGRWEKKYRNAKFYPRYKAAALAEIRVGRACAGGGGVDGLPALVDEQVTVQEAASEDLPPEVGSDSLGEDQADKALVVEATGNPIMTLQGAMFGFSGDGE